jgi:hypothetical protein
MAWWDDLWLNEGFASWAENYAADQNYPEYQMWPQFVNDHLSRALKLGKCELLYRAGVLHNVNLFVMLLVNNVELS